MPGKSWLDRIFGKRGNLDPDHDLRNHEASAPEGMVYEQTARVRLAQSRIAQALERPGSALNLSGLKLQSLPPSIGRLEHLRSLALQGNELADLPESIGQLTQLQYLDLSGNRLTRLPSAVTGFLNLEHLSVARNPLDLFPEDVGKLSMLRKLDLSRTQVNRLPEALAGLFALESLHLSDNPQLGGVIPDFIRNIPALTDLDLSNIQMSSLPGFMADMVGLRRLKVHTNRLVELPGWLMDLTNLETLSIAQNGIYALPETINCLQRLESLSAGSNRIRTLPESLCELENLELLALDHNPLESLPLSMGRLSKLKFLYLGTESEIFYYERDQQAWTIAFGEKSEAGVLSTLPESMLGLRALRELYLHGHARLGLPPELLGPSFDEVNRGLGRRGLANPAHILQYYFSRIQSRPLNEAKMILVGRGGAGKTSLVNRLVHGRFDRGEAKTDGISITPWRVRLGKDEVRLNIWDFGGQEIMHATHQFFLTKRSLYVLVLNA